MNPEKPQPTKEQYELTTGIIIERLEGPEEDIKREPLRLRKISKEEFNQKFSPEQRVQVQATLQKVIASSKYNTFNLFKGVFDEYCKVIEDGRIVSLAEILEKQDVAESDDNENGIMCAGMALKMKEYLVRQGVNAYLIRYAATGQINEAGDEYAGVGHISTVIPFVQDGKKMFTLVDAGLLVSKLIIFEDQQDSEMIYFRNKRCQVQYDPGNNNFPYKFIIEQQVTNKKTGEVETDENGNPVYKITDIAYFDPYHEILNPYVAVKDSMRTLPGYRLTAQDEQGQNTALVALDLVRKQIKVRYTLEDGTQQQEKLRFEDLYRLYETEMADILAKVSDQLGVSKEYILKNLQNIVSNYEIYIDQFLPPSVRREFKQKNNFKKYIKKVTEFLESIKIKGSEKFIILAFFTEILPSYASGEIFFHEHSYPLRFATKIRLGKSELTIPLVTELDKSEEISFIDAYPTLLISNPEKMVQAILDFMNIVKELKHKLLWLKSREHYSDEDVIRNVLTQIWFNANEYDFSNPIQFLKRQERLLCDSSFSEFEQETSLGAMATMGGNHLVVYRVQQSGSNESPYMMNIELHTEDGEGRADLPSIRYAVDTDRNGERIAYIYAIQKQKKKYDNEESQKLQKKINRLLFKLNKGVLDKESDEFKEYHSKRKAKALKGNESYPENISDVSPSAVFSLATFIALLKQRGITKIKAPVFLPLRWQAHERLGRKEQERIQENVTNKFIRTFRRIAHHFLSVEIFSYPEEGDGYLYVKLTDEPMVSDNHILNEMIELVNKKS